MKLLDLYEAKVSSKSTGVAMTKIIAYIERKMGVKLIKIPGVEHYHNSVDNGYGVRYVFDGSTRCVRFNWGSDSKTGNSSEIHSVDIFTGKSRNPNFHVQTKNISFVKSLPMIVSVLKSPSTGQRLMFPVDMKETINESTVFEAKRDDFTAEQALDGFLKQLSTGRSYTRSDFIGTYHIVNAGIFDTIFQDFSDKFKIEQKRVSIAPGSHIESLRDSILSKAGVVQVSAGGTDETFMKTPEEEAIGDSADERVPFGDQLEHLEGLTQGLIKGAFNALFVAGKGGTGKTTVVEKALAHAGLTDGQGYFKNTGSASPAGIYTLLYQHRNSIILFDDCDGALADTDSRNLIKAATDTKKVRKLVWNKKSSFIFDPESEDAEQYEDDESMAPKYFNFEGRIIFISNLPLNKLDPDGALRTRAFVINVDPTDDELVEHMGKILHTIQLEDGLSLSKEEKENVFEVVKSSKKKDVSLRKLVRALNLAASGAGNWEELVRLYA